MRALGLLHFSPSMKMRLSRGGAGSPEAAIPERVVLIISRASLHAARQYFILANDGVARSGGLPEAGYP